MTRPPTDQQMRLDGLTALVTGSGGGLGQAIGDRLAALGATVHGSSRSQSTSARIAERYGADAVTLDVTDAAGIEASLGAFLDDHPIDLLVNNAGINIPEKAVDVTPEHWDEVFATNVKGAFFVSTSVARRWIANGTRGRIVNVSSQAGIVAIEERASYGSSKAALNHLTKVLALEWAEFGIRVNAIAPTFVRTELTESTLSRPDWAGELLSRIPLGRFGQPEDISGAVAFLLSDWADLITGATLPIDGGYTIR